MMKKLLVFLCTVSLVFGVGSVNEDAHALTLKNLIDNNKSITVFDKEFSDFGEGYNSFETDLSKVLIEKSPDSTSNNVGIRITNTDPDHPWAPPDGSGTLTFEMNFDVKTTDGSKIISDIEVVLVKGLIQSDDPDDLYLWGNGFSGFLQAQAGPTEADIDPHVASLNDIWAKVDLNPGSSVESFDVFISQTPVPVPEPATMLLLGSGLVGLAGFRRKNKK